MSNKMLYVVLALFVFLRCNNLKDDAKKPRQIAADDFDFQSRIIRAKDSLSFFIRHIESHYYDSAYAYMINTPIKQAGKIEYLWFWVYSYDEKEFFCVLNSKPYYTTKYKQGDSIKIKGDDICDWMIYKGDSVINGNFVARKNK